MKQGIRDKQIYMLAWSPPLFGRLFGRSVGTCAPQAARDDAETVCWCSASVESRRQWLQTGWKIQLKTQLTPDRGTK